MRRPLVAVAAVLAAIGGICAVMFAPGARASTDGSSVSGSFGFKGSILIGCPKGALLCTRGSFTGGLQGTFTLTLLATVPSVDVGINYFTGKLAMESDSGNLNCTLDGALDSRPASEGEFGEICVITGGTGRYTNAKGDLRMIGTSTSTLLVPTGAGVFEGTITTP